MPRIAADLRITTSGQQYLRGHRLARERKLAPLRGRPRGVRSVRWM